MDLKELQKHWDAFGKRDPLWAILSSPDKIDKGWDQGEFFRTGESEIDATFAALAELGLPGRFDRGLDFGCGVGRLTQAMCGHLAEAVGVDISPTMIDLAGQYNQYPYRCHYFVNDGEDLGRFPASTFDFVYSNIVLQHMAPVYSERYIREFVRVLRLGGAAVFQIPSDVVTLEPEPGASAPDDSPVAIDAVSHAAGRLADDAFVAVIRPLLSAITAETSALFTLPVVVTNASPRTWPGRTQSTSPMRLGNHWLLPDGTLVVRDDGRASLEQALPSGGSVTLELNCRAPRTPGAYILELDIVREFVSWGHDLGSPTVRIPVTVDGASVADAGDETGGAVLVPRMEMYGIPRSDVVKIVRSAGGQIARIDDDLSAGKEWRSYRYVVTKRSR